MQKAFVLINSIVGLEEIVYEELKRLACVKEVWKVYGTYDIALKIEHASVVDLKYSVSNIIRKIEGVGSTRTMMIM